MAAGARTTRPTRGESYGDVVRHAQSVRASLLRREQLFGSTLFRQAYGSVWPKVQPTLDKLLGSAEELRRTTGRNSVSTFWTLSQPETAQLLRQLTKLLEHSAQMTADLTAPEQRRVIELGEKFATDVIRLAVESQGPLPENFAVRRVPLASLERLAGRFGTGTRIGDWLHAQVSTHVRRAQNELTTTLSAGMGGRAVRQRMQNVIAGAGLQAEAVAKTAIVQSYRNATIAGYRLNSELIAGWLWMSVLQPGRTCPVCWAMHGTFHRLEEDMDSHSQCHCTPVPVTRSFGELGVDAFGTPETALLMPKGVDLFGQLSEAKQLATLGPLKYAAYAAGDLALPDLIGRGTSPVWGPYLFERSGKSLGLSPTSASRV